MASPRAARAPGREEARSRRRRWRASRFAVVRGPGRPEADDAATS